MTDNNPRGIRPRGSLVLVHETSEHGWHQQEVKHGSLFIPVVQRQADPICHGTVVALGPNVSPSLGLQVGNTVHFKQECGTEVGERLLLIKQDMLMLVGPAHVTGVGA